MLTAQKTELRRLTDAAIENARRETSGKADQIFRTVLDHLKVEVAAGRNHAVVMSLREGNDYERNSVRSRRLEASGLTGIAARVFAQCKVFEPTLEYWSRVEGHQRDEYTVEGFNIVLHWKDGDDLIARVQKLGDSTFADSLKRTIEQIENAVADKVRGIISQLQEKALLQAKSGKDWAIVMSIKDGVDFQRPVSSRKGDCQPEWLGPVAKAVWEAVADYNPELQYWSREEGDQRDSYTVEGFNIVIHW